MTVFGLHGGVAAVIQGKPDDQSFNPAFVAEFFDLTEIVAEVATFQRFEWCDSQSKAVTACQSDSSTAYIKAESRSRAGT